MIERAITAAMRGDFNPSTLLALRREVRIVRQWDVHHIRSFEQASFWSALVWISSDADLKDACYMSRRVAQKEGNG